ncbi:MAG: general secretion pathway protein GspK [Planctomycetes bacterium]|nr:general secretion pathway protein GspK [Planctomycetota bacterium]
MKKLTNKIPVKRSPAPSIRHKGAALLMTLAVLVILTTIVFSMVSRLKVKKRRQQYMISYQAARYACDSAMKYALTKAKDIKPELTTRADSPDFSDLFYLTHQQQQEMLEEWAEIKTEELLEEQLNEEDDDEENPLAGLMESLSGMEGGGGFGDPNSGDLFNFNSTPGLREDGTIDPNSLTIPGPYGVDWPYISEPMEFKVGDAKVTIKIRDENAKMPLTWGIMKDEKELRAANDALLIFCQWMQMEDEHIETLMMQLEEVKKLKPYSKNLKPIVTLEKTTPSRTSRTSRTPRTSRRLSRPRTSTRTVTTKKTRPATGHTSDFARLLHSSLIDTTILSIPLPDTGERHESALKYLALWGSQKVNINSAPRQVLEAVFTFGGDQEDIADAIIQQRQIKPYKDIKDFKEQNYGFSDSIRKAEPYIVTESSFFAIEVTAVCGNAIVSSVATVKFEKGKPETIAIISN